jgi:hypothetical protein
MRRKARIDNNQNEIVRQLRKIPGFSVAITSALGDGFPDAVVGFRKKNLLIEIKDPKQPPSKRKLTEEEEKFHNSWTGEIYVVHTVDDVLKIFGLK